MKYFSKSRTILIGGICVGAFICIGILSNLSGGLIQAGDLFSESVLSHIRFPWLTSFMVLVTNIGDFDVLASIMIVTSVLFAVHKEWRPIYWLASSAILVSVITGVAKNYFQRMRPDSMGIFADGYSFPSGHTSGTFVIFVIIAWVFYTEVKNKKLQTVGTIVSIIVVLLVGFSRIYLGVHWLSDVYGGVLLALGLVLIVKGLVNFVADKISA